MTEESDSERESLETAEPSSCCVCQSEFSIGTQRERIDLWDGRSYCWQCLFSLAPDVAERARADPVLEESRVLSDRDWRDARRAAISEIALFFVAGPIFALAEFHRARNAIGASFLAISMWAMGFLRAYQRYFVLRHSDMFATVRVFDGMVQWSRAQGTEKYPEPRLAELSEAQWRVGKAKDDSYCKNTPIRRDVIIMELTYCDMGLTLKENVACGWTDETFSIWREFLTVCSLRQKHM